MPPDAGGPLGQTRGWRGWGQVRGPELGWKSPLGLPLTGPCTCPTVNQAS